MKSFGNDTKDTLSAWLKIKAVICNENKPHSHKKVVGQEK